MMKKRRIILALLCAVCLLAVSAGEAAPDVRSIRTVLGRIEQGAIPMMGDYLLIPDDCSGFELQYLPDLPDGFLDEILPGLPSPEADENTGMLRCPLDAETARWLFENSFAASIGPDGSILRVIYHPTRPFMIVEHGRTLVLAARSSGRGVPDTDGTLESALDYKLKIASNPAENEVRWSPDSRYLFFNDTDLWYGVQMALDDPYLLDTQTGDIFLLENGGSPKDPLHGTFRCVLNGRFSMDGKSFYWYCRSYVSGTPSHFLMRYDLETGEQETVCELNGALKDFCEMKRNCWFLLETGESGISLVRITLSPDGIDRTEEPLPVSWETCSFLPVVRENVLLAVTPLPSGGTYLLPLTWDSPVSASSWYKIGSVDADMLQEISPDEIAAEVQEAQNNGKVLSGSYNIGTAYIKHASAVIGATNLLMTVYIREPVPDSWGGGFSDFNGQVILNTEDLRLFPIRTGWSQDGLQDELIDGTFFLMKYYGQEVLGLYYADTLPDMPFLLGESYISPYGSFLCRNEGDPIVLTSVTLEKRECTADVTVAEDGYTISIRITDYPEPETVRQEFLVPEVLTEARMQEITAPMEKKTRKQFSGLYTKVAPEKLDKRANRDEILASYPSAATETLYILIGDARAANLETAEKALADAGYTAEDYAKDMALVAVPQETNVVVSKNGRNQTFPVRYAFSVPDPAQYPGSGRIQELAGLCDRICKAVTANLASETPVPVEDVILDKYDMGSVDFYVTVDHSEAVDNALEISLTVVP